MEDHLSYPYLRTNIMDERLAYLDADEKYALYLAWLDETEKSGKKKE